MKYWMLTFLLSGAIFFAWPWKSEKSMKINVGDEVWVTNNNFYNECSTVTVIGLQALSDMNVAWVLLEDCDWPGGYVERTTDIVDIQYLEKRKENE